MLIYETGKSTLGMHYHKEARDHLAVLASYRLPNKQDNTETHHANKHHSQRRK